MTTNTNQPLHVLIIGGTGMLGRPVVRRMAREGLNIRALVRDVERAQRLLPGSVELVPGDLRDVASIEAAMRGVDAVYTNLENSVTRKRPAWDPDGNGAMTVLQVAERSGIQRLGRISAIGVEEAADAWWPAAAKAEVDRAWMESNIATTIFRPTWFMESLPLFMMKNKIMMLRYRNTKLRWVAGDDLGRQVIATLTTDQPLNQICYVQGPERLTYREATERFAAALPNQPKVVEYPVWPFRVLGLFHAQVKYLIKLMDLTDEFFAPMADSLPESELPTATMRIEDYAQYMTDTGDVPKK